MTMEATRATDNGACPLLHASGATLDWLDRAKHVPAAETRITGFRRGTRVDRANRRRITSSDRERGVSSGVRPEGQRPGQRERGAPQGIRRHGPTPSERQRSVPPGVRSEGARSGERERGAPPSIRRHSPTPSGRERRTASDYVRWDGFDAQDSGVGSRRFRRVSNGVRAARRLLRRRRDRGRRRRVARLAGRRADILELLLGGWPRVATQRRVRRRAGQPRGVPAAT
jgi:hypothetical protein